MLNSTSSNPLVIRDYPIVLWLVSLPMIGTGVAVLVSQGINLGGIIAILVGLGLAALGSITTITVDRSIGTLILQKRRLIGSSEKTYSLREIVSIEVERSLSSGDTHQYLYRIAMILSSGERVPFSGAYSSGRTGKEKKAQKLRDYIGLAGPAPEKTVDVPGQILFDSHPGFTLFKSGESSGISWRLETAMLSSITIYRWVSPQVTSPDRFLAFFQKPKGSHDLGGNSGGILGKISNQIYQRLLIMYGIFPNDLPEIDIAQPLEPPEARLAPYFTSLTNDPEWARGLLNPWATSPLVGWAERYPLKELEIGLKTQIGSLAMLLSPEGLYLSLLASPSTEQVQALETLGVELAQNFK